MDKSKLKAFYEELEKHPDVKEGLLEFADKDQAQQIGAILAAAKELGIDMSEQDITLDSNEISADELDAVAGGGECACVAGGGGTSCDECRDNSRFADLTCACVMGGGGESCIIYSRKDKFARCVCVLVGSGTANTEPYDPKYNECPYNY